MESGSRWASEGVWEEPRDESARLKAQRDNQTLKHAVHGWTLRFPNYVSPAALEGLDCPHPSR